MCDLIQIKRGDKAGSALSDGELGYSREGKALYIGDAGTNQKICSATELEGKLTAVAAESQPELAEGSDISAVIAAVNSLISALRTSGIMK